MPRVQKSIIEEKEMKNVKKILLLVLVLALSSVSMLSCGDNSGVSYTLVHSYGESQPPITLTFKGGNLKISADTSGLNSAAADNLSVLMVTLGVNAGDYTYEEKGGVITTKESLSPLSSKVSEFRSYFDGKYMVASTFTPYEISTKETEGASEFTIASKGLLGSKMTFEFHSDGSFSMKEGELSGTYTFKDSLIEMSYDGQVQFRYLAIGDGTCYQEYLVKK